MNEKLQAAKDHAAMELYFCDYQQAIEENQLISNIERETFWHLAMEIYAEKQSKQFAEWIAQNCRMYDNEFSLYNLNKDVLEIRPISELYELFNLFKTTKP